MSVSAELAERAKRHGLERLDDGWYCSDGPAAAYSWLLSRYEQGWVWAVPNGGWIEYPTEAAALEAALHWLDHDQPSKAWRPSPARQLGRAVALLRSVYATFGYATGSRVREQQLRQAIDLLDAVALPSLQDEGTALLVAWDYLIARGHLIEDVRWTLVQALKVNPELLHGAKITGPWRQVNPGVWERHSLDHDPGCVLQVQRSGTSWWWFAYDPADGSQSLASGEAELVPGDAQMARDLGDQWAREQGWTLLGRKE